MGICFFFISLSFLHFVRCDFGLYGRIVDSVEILDAISKKKSYSTCFAGFGYTNCEAKQSDDDTVLENTLYYYKNFDLTRGTNYCLQCCNDIPGPDIWELQCLQYTDVGPKKQVYGYELRMARRLTLTDTEVIRCPIYRTACTYNESDPLQVITCAADDTSLWGFSVELWVTIRSKNFESWRSIEKCVVTADERSEALPNMELFSETYIIYHSRHPQSLSAFDGTLYSLISILAIYLLLYFFRRERCIICEKKLVFCCQRCYLCRFYGAHPPDPLLLKTMTEKSEYLQGEFPERFPGIKICRRCFSGIVSCGRGCCDCIGFIVTGIRYCFQCLFCCQWKQCWDSKYCCHGCCHLCEKVTKCCQCCRSSCACSCCCCKSCQKNSPIEPSTDSSSDPQKLGNEVTGPQSDEHEDDGLIHRTNSYQTLEEGGKRSLPGSSRRVPVRSRASIETSIVSSNPTAPGGIKAPKRLKKNPYRINVHPYFVYKALDHPHPPPAPLWVQHRDLDEYEE
jgi:hypothetical protein